MEKSNSDIDVNDFIKGSILYWSDHIEKLINNSLIERLKIKNIINIFKGDYTNTACFDLESKIIEAGIFNAIVHEKKEFFARKIC